MGIQETVVDLFQENRIDKATAYRLLSECKKAAAPAPSSSVMVQARLPRCSTPAAPLELAALAAWVGLLHVVTGSASLDIDYIDATRCIPLHVEMDETLTTQQLTQTLQTQLEATPLVRAPAPFVWALTPNVERSARQIVAYARPSTADAAWLEVEIHAQSTPPRATRVADWPETLAHLHAVMQEAPERPLVGLDKLPASHRRLLAAYNATSAYLPPQRTLPSLLDPVLDLEQDAIAVESRTEKLSYAQYKRHAYRLAHLLRCLGAQRNERIAVILHRDVRMPASLYGVVSSGAAYVPLEPDMPAERIAGILSEIGARIVVTDADTLHQGALRLAGLGVAHVVCLDGWPRDHYQGIPVAGPEALASMSDTAPPLTNAPDDLCYVIYTSGSTGKPKGVVISHLNIVNTLIGVNNVFNVGNDDSILCFSSYGFDLSVWDIFGAALAGATVFVPTKAEIRDPAALLHILREHRLTIWDSVPTGMSQLLLPLAGQDVPPVAGLRLAMLSGEFIPLSLPEDIHRVFPNCRVASLGGATEGTVWSIYHYPVDRVEPHWKSIPYGKPLPNQRMYVLNDALQACAIGEKGMLYIGGLGVAQGYFGDSERSRQAFVPAPWPNEPGGRIYRTGDLGLMHANGVIEIAGRADQQIKIRGFRVELGEVESQLNALADIDQAAVIAKHEAPHLVRLVAFYISRHGEISADTLRTQLAACLPEYMIPSAFVHLSDPPVGPTGKLDRKALEAIPIHRDGMGLQYAAPNDDAERHLAEALARILRLDQVGVDDDFFLIGGDSLLALQFISALSQLGYEASPMDIQQGRTIRGILARVRRLGTSEDDSGAGVIPLGPMGRKFFERLPLVNRKHWNQSIVVRFDHMPDTPRLRAALQRVLTHHPLLRAGYTQDGLTPVAPLDFDLPLIDVQSPLFWRRSHAYTRAIEALQGSIRLDAGQMSKAALLRLRPDDVRLIWVVHHLCVDAHSWRIMIEDLVTAYRSPHAPLLRATPYRSYTATVSEHVAGACNALRTVAPLPPMATPTRRAVDHAPTANLERDGRLLHFGLSVAHTRRLFQAVQQDGAPSLHLVLLAALAQALKHWTDDPQVRFDIVSNGRDIDPSQDASRTVGWFATHNPFDALIPEATDDVLRQITAAWQRHQATSRFFVAACNAARNQPDHPYAHYADQVLLYNYLGVFDSLDLPEGWSVLGSAGQDRGPENPRTHPLELDALVSGKVLRVGLRYGRTHTPRREARRLLTLFRVHLMDLIAYLEARISPLSLAHSSASSGVAAKPGLPGAR